VIGTPPKVIMHPVLLLTQIGSFGSSVDQRQAKSASAYISNDNVESGLRINPLSLVPFRYLAIIFMAISWTNFGQ